MLKNATESLETELTNVDKEVRSLEAEAWLLAPHAEAPARSP